MREGKQEKLVAGSYRAQQAVPRGAGCLSGHAGARGWASAAGKTDGGATSGWGGKNGGGGGQSWGGGGHGGYDQVWSINSENICFNVMRLLVLLHTNFLSF